MAVRLATKHSMLRRCRGWDYRQPCIYQITLVLADRKSKALGRLVIGREPPPSLEAHIALTPAGEAVKREFLRIGEHHPEIEPLFIQVMPDHVHFIIHVRQLMARPLGQAIAGFKTGSSKAAIGRGGLWAEGFQDTILFHEGQLDAMFNYLRDNPRRLAVKQLRPEMFRVRNDLCLALPRQAQDRALPRQAQDRALPYQAQDRAPCSVLGAEAPSYEAHFSAIGNIFLLDSPNIVQVQCSRAYLSYKRLPKPGGGLKIARDAAGVPVVEKITPEFEEKREQLLAAARHGAVLISPCISDGEREIARLAFAASLPVIALRNMGFPALYKPGGKLFDKTANGKLLMLAPAAWPYSTAEKPMTRFDACALNRIAQLIAGEGAAEINYRGMKPHDIDRLVREAVNRTIEKSPSYLARISSRTVLGASSNASGSIE